MLDEKIIYFAGRDESVIIPNKREENGNKVAQGIN